MSGLIKSRTAIAAQVSGDLVLTTLLAAIRQSDLGRVMVAPRR
jgi:hypothetical protein